MLDSVVVCYPVDILHVPVSDLAGRPLTLSFGYSHSQKKKNSKFLKTKADAFFCIFFLVFGLANNIALTYKIHEFKQPWPPVPLQWRLVISDVAIAWVMLVIWGVWTVVEFVSLRKRFGASIMWTIALPKLNEELAQSHYAVSSQEKLETESDESHNWPRLDDESRNWPRLDDESRNWPRLDDESRNWPRLE